MKERDRGWAIQERRVGNRRGATLKLSCPSAFNRQNIPTITSYFERLKKKIVQRIFLNFFFFLTLRCCIYVYYYNNTYRKNPTTFVTHNILIYSHEYYVNYYACATQVEICPLGIIIINDI